jgi:hypothetical protein
MWQRRAFGHCYSGHMVRRGAEEELTPTRGEGISAGHATPTCEMTVPAGVGAPGGGPQVVEGVLPSRAGRQRPVKRRKACSGGPARGPQHEVKRAASTPAQAAVRAAHGTAKATSPAREPKLTGGCGGVGGAARAQGQVRNVRGLSARPESGPACSPESPERSPGVRSGWIHRDSAGGSQYRTAGCTARRARPCGIMRLEGRVPAVVRLRQRASLGGRPARPDLGTPLDISLTPKGGNCKGSSGLRPGGYRADARRCGTCPLQPNRAMLRADDPWSSRVREIRMHGLSGGVGLHRNLLAR